jgi:hypothetical protein
MSETEADLVWLSSTNFTYLAIGGAVGLFFTTLKVLFGSYSLPYILREYKKQSHIESTYDKMFRSRENYCYHIAGARARGDHDDAKRLARDLVAFEKEIDSFEETHFSKKLTKKLVGV